MKHYLFKNDIYTESTDGLEPAMFGMGCFWGAEKKFWCIDGVKMTCVGYSGGITQNPSYKDVCSGLTGHNEVVRILFDPHIVSFDMLLKIFWENHDPTQKNRQGNDIGTQYRSGAYFFCDEQRLTIDKTRLKYQEALINAGHGRIVTEVKKAPKFYMAEDYHQQYLAKNPLGYCGLGGTGVVMTSATVSKAKVH